MTRTRRTRPQKPDKVAKARWYAAHGYPIAYIATRLDVHRNSVRRWVQPAASARSVDRLVTRLRNLPAATLRTVLSRVPGASQAA